MLMALYGNQTGSARYTQDLCWHAGHHIEGQVLGFAQDDQSLVLCSGQTMVVCSTSNRFDQPALTQAY